MKALTRTVIRYHGGKFKLAPWIISHFPPHHCYVEPFGGAASVLMRKERSYAEVYNDLNDDLVMLFKVLRDPGQSAELERLLRLTPFARQEFKAAYEPCEEPIERARRIIIRAFMGFGSAGVISHHRTGFRSNTARSNTTPAHDWKNYPDVMPWFLERLRGVVIECRDAVVCMKHHDSDETLHYVDPPYVHSTRSLKRRRSGQVYTHEMADDEHRRLLLALRELKGGCVLSGYRSEIYDELMGDWLRVDRQAFADGARKRTESLWLNAPVAAHLQQFGLAA